jgi:lipoyl-dependent peroxiredoxin
VIKKIIVKDTVINDTGNSWPNKSFEQDIITDLDHLTNRRNVTSAADLQKSAALPYLRTQQQTSLHMKRNATAVWKGTGKEGSGVLSTQSTTLNKTQYSFNSRFAEGVGTNPEELVAAAHAGCFSMKLSFIIGDAGFKPEEITTQCAVTIEDGTVTSSQLTLKAKVPGIDQTKFKECAEQAKKECPISKLLNTNITLDATLLS